MKPTLGEDVTSIVAIATGALVSAGLTVALLAREADSHTMVIVRGELVGADVHIQWLHQPVLKMAGPEGPHSGWVATPRPHEPALRDLEVILEKARQESRH